MKKILIATYGSLRKGFHNHSWLGENAVFKGIDKITGVMYLNHSYPHLYHPDGLGGPYCEDLQRSHKVEIYEIDKENFENIDRIEKASGYELEKYYTKFGTAKIWFNPHTLNPENLVWIEAYTPELLKEKIKNY